MTIELTELKLTRLCRDIENALMDKECGFASAQNSADPTSGAAQIIRGNATFKSILSTLRVLGVEAEITEESIALYSINDPDRADLIRMKR